MWFRRLEARKGKQWYLMWKEDCLETICADMEEYDEFYISPVAFSEELENYTSIERVRSIKIRTRGFWLAWPFGGDFKGVKRLLRAYHFDLDHIFYVRGKRCSWLYLDNSLKGIGYCEFDNWMDYNFNTRSMLRVAGFENCRHEKFFWDMKEDVFDSGIRGGEFKHCEMQGVKNLYVNDEEIFSTCPYWIYAAQNKMNISEEQLLGILLSFRRLKDGIDFFDSRQKKRCCSIDQKRWDKMLSETVVKAKWRAKRNCNKTSCVELSKLFDGVACNKNCGLSSPAEKKYISASWYRHMMPFYKALLRFQSANLKKTGSFTTSSLEFADEKLGRLVSFHNADGCIKECPLTIRDLHGKRFVEKLEESGLGIMNTPENVRLLRYKILNGPCDGTAFSVRKTGWNTVNDENVFVTAYGCYPTPSCKIIPQIPGGIVYPHTCLSKSHLPQLSFLRELPPSAQNILYFLFGVMASGPLLNSIPKSHAFFHVFGLSDECATFWAEFMGMFSSVGNPLPASWYFSDFMKKKKSLSAYQDATVVFKPLGASEHRCYRNFVNKVCKSRRNFTCSSRKSVRIVRDPGPEDELRIAALSFGKEAVCGMSPQEKKLEYVGTKKDVYLENIKASKEMEEWFQENEKQCREILRMWRPYRGLFYQQLVEKLFSDGKRKLLDGQYCPRTEALERRGKELVYMAQDLQAFKDIEIDLSIPRGVKGRGIMGETKFEDLEPCDEKWEKILKEVQEDVGKLHKGFKPHEIVHHKYFSFLMYKGTYCYFDRGEIFTKKFKKKNKLNPFVDYLKKQKILVPAKSRNSVSLWIPKTNIGKKDKPRYIGGRCLYGYAMSFKRLSEWGRKPVSKDFDACKALQGCKELDQKNSHSKKWEQALQSFLSSGNAQKI